MSARPDVAIDESTGIFIALSPQPKDRVDFRLAACDSNAELDRIEYRDPLRVVQPAAADQAERQRAPVKLLGWL